MVSTANTEIVANEYSTHMVDEKVGPSITETEHACIEPARRASDSAGRQSSKGDHISCSSISDPRKRLKPVVFHQPRDVSFQDKTTSKATQTATPDLTTHKESQCGLSTSDKASNSKVEYLRICQPSPHHPSGFTRDIVSLAVKQHELVYLYTLTQMQKYLAYSAPCQHAATGGNCHDLQEFTRSSAAQCGSISVTHATGSDNASQRSTTTTHAQERTTGNGLAGRRGYSMNAQTSGLGSGDGGDDPDDHNKQFKPLRDHEMNTTNGERKLMLDVCAKFHRQSHLQRSKDSESTMEADQGRPRYDRAKSCSCSNNAIRSFAVGLAQRSESAPAQTQYFQGINRDEPNTENDNPPSSDDEHLRQALICRSRMVKASDITGEPTVDAPWVHPMRPSSLLALRRGAEGYGGYGGLASLPNANTSSQVENERIAPESLLGAHEPNAMNHQTATNRDSFSFISSISSISQHVAVVEEPMEEPDDGRLPQDRGSVISQHTALVEGPPEELISTYALQSRGLIEARFAPSTTDMENSEHVECSEPRRPSVPHITPQAPGGSYSADELSTHTKSQTGSIRQGIRERCAERRRQGSSWSSALCCLGNTEHDRQSSPENERSSSDTGHSQNRTSQNHNQDRRILGSHTGGRQASSLGQSRTATEVLQETYGRVSEQTSAVMDTAGTSEKFAESESDPHAMMISTICPRTRLAEENE